MTEHNAPDIEALPEAIQAAIKEAEGHRVRYLAKRERLGTLSERACEVTR